jgi:hypothetical protein
MIRMTTVTGGLEQHAGNMMWQKSARNLADFAKE